MPTIEGRRVRIATEAVVVVLAATGFGIREAALAYARRFDWNVLFGDALAELDASPRTNPTR